MVNVVIVKKNGDFEGKKIKDFDVTTLYKSCGYKKSLNFEKLCTWRIPDHYYVSIFGRKTGSAGMENKFDFPPPVDNAMFYGNIAIVCTTEANITSVVDYKVKQWDEDYETLMGGFEDLGSEDSESEDEDEMENYPEEMITKEGYLKDSFIASDDSEESGEESTSEDEYEDSELDEEEYNYDEDSD